MTTLFSDTSRIEVQYGVYGPASGRTHKGVDIDTLPGMDATVHSTVAGRVEFAGVVAKGPDRTWEWGWHVRVIEDGTGHRHTFAHCKAGSLRVKAGDRVVPGQPLATMGKTGNAEYDRQAEHVHYQVDRRAPSGWVAIDPTPWCGGSNRVGTWPAVGYKKEDDTVKFKIYAPMNKPVSSQMVKEGVVAIKGNDRKLRAYNLAGDARMVRGYTDGSMSRVFEAMTKEMQAHELMISTD